MYTNPPQQNVPETTSQVNTYWSWTDVQRADMYLAQIERMHAQNASSAEYGANSHFIFCNTDIICRYAEFAVNEFRKLGLASSTQQYSYTTSAGVCVNLWQFMSTYLTIKNQQMKSGVNAYALSSSPRASGAEAIVISASWLSCIDEGHGSPNHRGVATVLSMAAFLKRRQILPPFHPLLTALEYSHWAKDLVFVISDGYLEGMHAWLSAYHHSTPQDSTYL
jgi:glycosylphosphatidylinositol transamidase